MFSEKSDLLEQISQAIKKKWFKKNNSGGNNHSAAEIAPNEANSVQNAIPFSNQTCLKRLEERIEALEHVNDHLTYFINFLIDNLPDLVITSLHTEWEEQQAMIDKSDKDKIKSGPVVSRFKKEKTPCPTRREKDILELLMKGLCAKEIANRLFISETTVITHKKNLKEKFQARNTVELISKAHIFLSDHK